MNSPKKGNKENVENVRFAIEKLFGTPIHLYGAERCNYDILRNYCLEYRD